jgi:hypothetical protein
MSASAIEVPGVNERQNIVASLPARSATAKRTISPKSETGWVGYTATASARRRRPNAHADIATRRGRIRGAIARACCILPAEREGARPS